jgi:four helix bundle protein
MASYQISKAWHLGHELTAEIHAITGSLPRYHRIKVMKQLHQYAPVIPRHIESSLEKPLHQQLEHYRTARELLISIQEDLMTARDRNYIEHELSEQLARKAITIQHLLTEVIQAGKAKLAAE